MLYLCQGQHAGLSQQADRWAGLMRKQAAASRGHRAHVHINGGSFTPYRGRAAVSGEPKSIINQTNIKATLGASIQFC